MRRILKRGYILDLCRGETDRDAFRAGYEVCRRPRWLACWFNGFDMWKQFFPQNAHFHSRQMLAQTNMCAIAVRQLFVWCAFVIKSEWVVEYSIITVC